MSNVDVYFNHETMTHKRWWKLAGITLLAAILDMVAHALAPQISDAALSGASGEVALAPSALGASPLLVPVLLLYLLVTFGALALTFVALQARLLYRKWRKGLWYGLAFGGLWYIGMFEGVVLWGTPLAQELFMGLADAIPIFLLGLLLGGFVALDAPSSGELGSASGPGRASPGVIPVIGGMYLIGRYVAYGILGIDSAYLARPLATALWTAALGAWIGVGY